MLASTHTQQRCYGLAFWAAFGFVRLSCLELAEAKRMAGRRRIPSVCYQPENAYLVLGHPSKPAAHQLRLVRLYLPLLLNSLLVTPSPNYIPYFSADNDVVIDKTVSTLLTQCRQALIRIDQLPRPQLSSWHTPWSYDFTPVLGRTQAPKRQSHRDSTGVLPLSFLWDAGLRPTASANKPNQKVLLSQTQAQPQPAYLLCLLQNVTTHPYVTLHPSCEPSVAPPRS